eukprot:TRINITY_DN5554_c0_g1_i1.p1 TRINITY_DN5554_c0_g1~~TRINITY_DN5554_c0_g1_i1.p1  ORF type:complete len:175 (+),score=23.80 TRINITY_DN5554_c0_g1_i1:590-1114(+)
MCGSDVIPTLAKCFPNLKNLTLNSWLHAGMDEIECTDIFSVWSLENLRIDFMDLREIASWPKNIDSLHSLELVSCSNMEAFADVGEKFPNLKRLKIDVEIWVFFSDIANFPQLESLDMTCFTVMGMDRLLDEEYLKTLHDFRVENSAIRPVGREVCIQLAEERPDLKLHYLLIK